jgi:hypothetical protein
MKRLSDILTPEQHEEWRIYLREQGETEAVELIDALYEYASDTELYAGDLVRGAKMIVRSDETIHKIYPNTNTCRSKPGLVAGQAMTPHCAVTCSNIDHQVDRVNHQSIIIVLNRLIEEYTHTD